MKNIRFLFLVALYTICQIKLIIFGNREIRKIVDGGIEKILKDKDLVVTVHGNGLYEMNGVLIYPSFFRDGVSVRTGTSDNCHFEDITSPILATRVYCHLMDMDTEKVVQYRLKAARETFGG